jgi:hypothetical protein
VTGSWFTAERIVESVDSSRNRAVARFALATLLNQPVAARTVGNAHSRVLLCARSSSGEGHAGRSLVVRRDHLAVPLTTRESELHAFERSADDQTGLATSLFLATLFGSIEI